MSLVPDYGDSTDSSDSSSVGDSEDPSDQTPVLNQEEKSAQPTVKLPTPGFIGNREDNGNDDLPTTSVFTNPFIEAEIAKDAVLERHVKMINTRDNTKTINGKKICWNYRKGRCRFGHNCKYAHDSDIQKTKEQLDAENQLQQTVLCQSQNMPQPTENDMKCFAEDATADGKRKRPGLTQGLIPGKKVMKSYNAHKK